MFRIGADGEELANADTADAAKRIRLQGTQMVFISLSLLALGILFRCSDVNHQSACSDLPIRPMNHPILLVFFGYLPRFNKPSYVMAELDDFVD